MSRPASDLISKSDDASNTKNKFLQQAREARIARELGQKQNDGATKLQAFFKSIQCRRRLKIEVCNELHSIVSHKIDTKQDDKHSKNELTLLKIIRKIIFHCDIKKDRDIMNKLIQLLASDLQEPTVNETITEMSNHVSEDNDSHKIDSATLEKNKLSTFKDSRKLDAILIKKILEDNADLKQTLSLAISITNLCLDKIIEAAESKSIAAIESNLLASNSLTVVNSLISLNSNEIKTHHSTLSWDKVNKFTDEIISQTIFKRNILDHTASIVMDNKKFNSDATNKLLVNFVQLFIKLTDLNSMSCHVAKDNFTRLNHVKELVGNLKRFLAVPAITLLLEEHSPKHLELVNEKGLFLTTLSTLTCHFDLIQDNTTSIQALCILANMIHLSSINEDILEKYLIDFCGLMTRLLQLCRKNCAQNTQANYIYNDLITSANDINNDNKTNGLKLKSARPKDLSYNPILGWLERDKDIRLDKSQLMKQLGKLWTARYLKILFAESIRINESAVSRQQQHQTDAVNIFQSTLQATKLGNNECDNNNAQFQETKAADVIAEESPALLASVNLFKRMTRWKIIAMGSQQPSCELDNGILPNSCRQATSFLGYYGRPKFLGGSGASKCRLLTPEAYRIGGCCQLLLEAIENLAMIRQDILTNICMHHYILLNLWTFIKSLGPNNGLQAYLELLPLTRKTLTANSSNNNNKINCAQQPDLVIGEFQILAFFCECASNLINVLDESELYDLQKPFKHEDLLAISSFMNNFVYQVLSFNSGGRSNSMELFGCSDLTTATKSEIFTKLVQSPHKLLKDLYTRNCRRSFAPKEHWFIKDLRVSTFLKDIEAKKLTAFRVLQMIPHVIPHKERVLIFRKFISMDKLVARPSTLISIHRSRIVEDGYQQLARLAPDALKGLIRVKFINDFGLGEAGIDQDGVFKEFLEDTMKRVFDPALNLFKTTSEQCLYPSPTSCLHENYESLFNFVGKMLGKAVYEGIMVDLPFAPFFLRRVVGQPQNALYSPLDELPSLDPELFKSLTYIKHYEGDVSELALTFCIDQDFMGKIETHELEPGGRSTPVTRENRVRYIHLVADFHLRKQIARQTHAFIRGFQSIIEPGWLTMFSASDLQNLISGENMPIDLCDLRKSTKYSGGFHNNHRVVCWLWDILDKDFTAEEHKLFLKFVTSCSKPPLLGFSNLEPPFSIRCIEVSDDLDLGDTLGSIVRGFLAIRRSDPIDRLPTSSTCFNLLKLPNYQRRSTLKEKLRYAIHSNAGFELS